jgi:hypothetical protein
MRAFQISPPAPTALGFATELNHGEWRGTVPHWFPLLVLACLGVVLKPRPRLKIGIRDLLILTTVVAIGIALLMAWMRNGERRWDNLNDAFNHVAEVRPRSNPHTGARAGRA